MEHHCAPWFWRGDKEVWKTLSARLCRGVYWWLFGSVGSASGPWTVLSELVLTNCSFGCGGDCGGGIKGASSVRHLVLKCIYLKIHSNIIYFYIVVLKAK